MTIVRRGWMVLAGVALAIACSSSGSGNGSGGGVCTTSCPKPCVTDTDCPSAQPLCANFGSASACVPLDTPIPDFCTSDASCNTAAGQVCCATNPASSSTVCAPADECLTQCTIDAECSGGTPKCCTTLARPICTATDDCPVACAATSDCNTAVGDICCTTIHTGDASGMLSASLTGACRPVATCPATCTQDSDCTSASGFQELCCNGICSSSCAKTCSADSDCNENANELCCTSPVLTSPWYQFEPTVTVTTPVVGDDTCQTLDACCSSLPSVDETSCLDVVNSQIATNCQSYLTTLTNAGMCTGDTIIGASGESDSTDDIGSSDTTDDTDTTDTTDDSSVSDSSDSGDCTSTGCPTGETCEDVGGTFECVVSGDSDAG